MFSPEIPRVPSHFGADKINKVIPLMSILMSFSITKTCLLKYTENFTTKKWKFSDKKKSDIFPISAQNIDCGYSLEPPLTSTHNLCFWAKIRKIMYTPVNPSFTI